MLVAECKMKRMKKNVMTIRWAYTMQRIKCSRLTWAVFSLLCLQPFFGISLCFFLSFSTISSSQFFHLFSIVFITYEPSFPIYTITKIVLTITIHTTDKKEIVAFNSLLCSLCICLQRENELGSWRQRHHRFCGYMTQLTHCQVDRNARNVGYRIASTNFSGEISNRSVHSHFVLQ